MADNTVLNLGTGGDTIATDDVAGIKFQRVKLVNGTLDATDAIPGDAANGLDVDVTRMPTTAADNAVGLPVVVGVVGGFDGTNVQAVTTNAAGNLQVGLSAALPTGTNTVGKVGHDTTGGGVGRKVVTTAGTRVDLAASTVAKWVAITALSTNTGTVVVGPGAVIAAAGTREGTPLAASDSVVFPVANLLDVKVDATVSGEGVSYSYGT